MELARQISMQRLIKIFIHLLKPFNAFIQKNRVNYPLNICQFRNIIRFSYLKSLLHHTQFHFYRILHIHQKHRNFNYRVGNFSYNSHSTKIHFFSLLRKPIAKHFPKLVFTIWAPYRAFAHSPRGSLRSPLRAIRSITGAGICVLWSFNCKFDYPALTNLVIVFISKKTPRYSFVVQLSAFVTVFFNFLPVASLVIYYNQVFLNI